MACGQDMEVIARSERFRRPRHTVLLTATPLFTMYGVRATASPSVCLPVCLPD